MSIIKKNNGNSLQMISLLTILPDSKKPTEKKLQIT